MKLLAFSGALLSVVLITANQASAQFILEGQGSINVEGIDIVGGGSDNDQVNNTTEAEGIRDATRAELSPGGSGLINGGVWNVGSYFKGTTTDNTNWQDDGDRDFSPSNPWPGGQSGSDFVVTASFALELPAGDYTIFSDGDDGVSLTLTDPEGNPIDFDLKAGNSQPQGASNELRFEAPTGDHQTSGQLSLAEDTQLLVEALFWERGGGDHWEISIIDELASHPGNANSDGFVLFQDGAVLANGTTIAVGTGFAAVVPEPTSIAIWSLLGMALAAFGYLRTRRKN